MQREHTEEDGMPSYVHHVIVAESVVGMFPIDWCKTVMIAPPVSFPFQALTHLAMLDYARQYYNEPAAFILL